MDLRPQRIEVTVEDYKFRRGMDGVRREIRESRDGVTRLDRALEKLGVRSSRYGSSVSDAFRHAGRAADDYADTAVRGAHRVEAAVDRQSKSVGLVGRAWNRVRSAVAGYLALAAARELVQASDAAFELAANVGEVENRFRSVFGGAAGDLDRFLTGMANTAGQTRTEARRTLSAYGAMFKGLGDSSEEAASKARLAWESAGDLQSAANITDAYERVTAALSGSSEVMDQFGINLKEGALAEFALSQGVGESTKTMSEAEKVSLRLLKIRSDLARQGALGDLLKTADSDANRARALAAAYRDAAEAASVELLPAFALVADAAEDALGTLDGPTLGKAFGRFAFGVVAEARRIVLWVKQVAAGFGDWLRVLRVTRQPVEDTAEATRHGTDALFGMADAVAAGAQAWAGFMGRMNRVRQALRSAVADMVRTVADGVDRMAEALSGFSLGGLTTDLGIDTPFGRLDLPDLSGLQKLEDAVRGIGDRLSGATDRARAFADTQEALSDDAGELAGMFEHEADAIAENRLQRDRARDVLEASIEARRVETEADRAAIAALGDRTDATDDDTTSTDDHTRATGADADALARQRRQLEEAARALRDLAEARDLSITRTDRERDAVRRYHDAVRELAEYVGPGGQDTPLAAAVRSLGADAAAVLDARITQLEAIRDRAKEIVVFAAVDRAGFIPRGAIRPRGPVVGPTPDTTADGALDPAAALDRQALARAQQAAEAYRDTMTRLRAEVEAGARTEASYGKAAEAAKAEAASALRGVLAGMVALGGKTASLQTVVALLDGIIEKRAEADEEKKGKWAADLADDLWDAVKAADGLADALDGVGAKKLASVVRAGADVLASGATLAAGVGSGNPVQIAQGAIQLVGALSNLKDAVFGNAEAIRQQTRAFETSAREIRAYTDAMRSGLVGRDVSEDAAAAYDPSMIEGGRATLRNAHNYGPLGTSGWSEAEDYFEDMIADLEAAGLDVTGLEEGLRSAMAIEDHDERKRAMYALLGDIEDRFGDFSNLLGTYSADLEGSLARYNDAIEYGGESVAEAYARLMSDLRGFDLGEGWQGLLDELEGVEPGTPEWEAAVAEIWKMLEADPSLMPDGISREDLERIFELRGASGSGAGGSTQATSISSVTAVQGSQMLAYDQEQLRAQRAILAQEEQTNRLLSQIYAVLGDAAAPAVPASKAVPDVVVNGRVGDGPHAVINIHTGPFRWAREDIRKLSRDVEIELARKLMAPHIPNLRG